MPGRGPARELTLVSAPAGLGKTSLLGDWARRGQRPVAWLSLDPGDSDAARFWRYLAAALDWVHQGVGEQITALLRGPQPPLQAVVTAAVNALAARPGEAAVVLDDYHLIEARPVHNSLGMLLERLPAQLRLVVAGRADPPLPLARLRARGQLTEVRERDLRFTPEEAAGLLGEVMSLELPASSVAALAGRTEGWAAGLQLAALSLRGHADPAGFVAGFSGSHRYILDYLTEEVLDRQPEQVRSFLLATSVLERLSGPLCDAITGRTDSQALLESIERANLFLVPLDEVRGWWRYHQLFADLLRERLQQGHPGRVAGLHRAAGAWHERHGLADDAIRHALAAGDPRWAARLVERHFEAQYRRSETATVQRWFAAFPDELIRSRPRLCLAMASRASIAGRLEEVESLVADAERAPAAGADEPFEPSVGRQVSTLANITATIAQLRGELARQRGDPEGAARFARQSLASLTEADRTSRAMVHWQLAMTEWVRGRPVQAEQMLAEVVADPFLLSVRPWYDLGHVQQVQGRLGDALRTFGRAVEVASEAGQPLPLAGLGHVGLADMQSSIGVQRARLAVAQGRTADAARWLGERGVGVEDGPSYLREREQLALVRVLLASDQAGTALPLLARLHQLASEQGRVGSVVEVQALRALALAARREEAAARRALVEALTLAAPEGYVRVFVEEGAPMAALLGRHVTAASSLHPVPATYLDRLLAGFGRAGVPVLCGPAGATPSRGRPRPGAGAAAVGAAGQAAAAAPAGGAEHLGQVDGVAAELIHPPRGYSVIRRRGPQGARGSRGCAAW